MKIKKIISILLSLIIMISVVQISSISASAGAKIDAAVSWALGIAANNNYGYKYGSWGPYDYDCSAFVITAYEKAGVPVYTNGARTTSNMYDIFIDTGFIDVTSSIDKSTGRGLQKGDLCLRPGKPGHVVMVSNVDANGNVTLVHASSDLDGVSGDSSGNEITTYPYRSTESWPIILRYNADTLSLAGNYESCTAVGGGVNVIGWAFDPNALGTSIDIHVYLGGTYDTSGVEGHNIGKTSIYRPDVNSTKNTTGNNGFNNIVSTSRRGKQSVYVYAIGTKGDNMLLPGSPKVVDIPYVIKLNANGGTGNTTQVAATYAGAMPSVTVPTRAGYTFMGYYDTSAQTGGKQYYNSTGVSTRTWNKTTDATLYARWNMVSLAGNYESCTAVGGGVNVIGWAFDPYKLGTSIEIHVYFGGTYDTSGVEGHVIGKTSIYRPDVNSIKSTTGNNGFNNIVSTSRRGKQSVYVYAIGVRGNNLLLPGSPMEVDIPYVIKLNANGGTGNTTQVAATYAGTMPSVTVPTRTGYAFAGYYDTSAQTGGTQYYNNKGISVRTWNKTTDATLYARWIQLQYTVILNHNGGKGNIPYVMSKYGNEMPPITSLPTREGYTFKGYFDTSAETGGTQYYYSTGESARTWNKASGATLYARWTINNTITLNKNGGTGGTSSVTVARGRDMPTTTVPTRTGYAFAGYYDTSAQTGGTQYYNNKGISERTWNKDVDTTLYARWVAYTYTLMLNHNGGTGYPYVIAKYDDAMPPLTLLPTREGYTFKGYFDTSAETGGTQYYYSTGESARTWDKASAITLYARWTVNNTITLDKNGGTGGASSVTVPRGLEMPKITVPTRAGYTFSGYYDTVDYSNGTKYYNSTGTSARTWNKDVDTTLYARWIVNNTITLDKNGGTGGASSVTVPRGLEMPKITVPTRSGYTFSGYYDTVNYADGTKYYNSTGTSAQKWDKSVNTTLYARWIVNNSITLDKNGGTGGTSSVTVARGLEMPTITIPTRTGYTFGGYYETIDYSDGTQYYNSTGTSAQKWNKSVDTRLYALWILNT